MISRTLLVVVCVILAKIPAQTAYVSIKNLWQEPIPPNPITVVGRVVSDTPVRISDGSGEAIVEGLTAMIGDYLVVTGNWDGAKITASDRIKGYIGPAYIEMMYVPAGVFLMGNSGIGNDEIYGGFEEYPQHLVYVSGFWIGKREVTRGEYRQFMEAGGYSNELYWSPSGWIWRTANARTQPDYWAPTQNWGTGSFTQTDSHPVVGVTYYEAEAFCNWAGVMLPTEAQWEKTARWSETQPYVYPWNNEWDTEKCNNYEDSAPAGGGYAKWQTAPCGSYEDSSPYGCLDMAGNVSEWCRDWYSNTYYSQTPPNGWVDPLGPLSGTARVLRGGSWFDTDDYCRCAHRSGFSPTSTWSTRGFRVAR